MAQRNSNPPSPRSSALTMNSARGSPPATPPSPPEANDSEVKLPKKREREVSLEPVTTPRLQNDGDSIRHDMARTPAKKNRRHLDSTREEEDASRSRSPSPSLLGTSPPQEIKMKVRQISQGVEDLNWRNMKPMTEDEEADMDHEASAGNVADDTQTTLAGAAAANGVTDHTSPSQAQSTPEPQDSSHLTVAGTPNDTGAEDTPAQQQKESARRGSESDGTEDSKGVKRKFFQRGTSQGPHENGTSSSSAAIAEPAKRPRDDNDKDDNPRETKRPSPPPEKEKTQPEPVTSPAPKFGGFMSYASASSPFAAVKGKSVFSTSSKSPPPPASAASPTPSPFSSFSSTSTLTSPTKRSGFEAFASSASPFASVARSKSPGLGSSSKLNRNKSPPRRANPANINAFSSYATTGIAAFSAPTPKRARATSPNGASSSSRSSLERSAMKESLGVESSGNEDERDDRQLTFGEKLRASKDNGEDTKSEEEDAKIVLTEQDVLTGEEDEETLHQVRGKLFTLGDTNQWKEKGTGLLRLNVRRSDGGGARLVMRKEAVYTVLLNVTLFHGMRCTLAQDPRYLRFSVIEAGMTTHYNLRVSNAKIAQELLEEIEANIPPA
ncbi:RanBD1 domain-containing protein [Pleurotus pulmonarius]